MLLSATNIVKAKLINLWVVFETIRINGRCLALRHRGRYRPVEAGESPIWSTNLIDLEFVQETKRQNGASASRRRRSASARTAPSRSASMSISVRCPSSPSISPARSCIARTGRFDDLEPHHAVVELERAARRLMAASAIPADRFLGIGLATPGPFAVPGLSPPRLPGWDGLALRGSGRGNWLSGVARQ